jgi:hypothetical protein
LRKLLSLSASAALLLSVLAAGPVAAYSDYFDACSYTPSTVRTWMIQEKINTDPAPVGSGTVGNMSGADMTMVLGSTYWPACFNGNGVYEGWTGSYDTLQQDGGAGIVQVGVGQDTHWNALRFVYTPVDGDADGATAGGMSEATWATPAIGQPTAGHVYKFHIQMTGSLSLNPGWVICIYDLSAQTAACTYINRHWHNSYYGYYQTGGSTGGHAWWGFETQNKSDDMSQRYPNGGWSYVYDLRYLRYSDKTWYYRSGFNSCVSVSQNGNGQDVPVPDYYHCSTFTTHYYQDTVRTYTTIHTVSS